MSVGELIWVTLGMIGQIMFSLRFLFQWLASEKAHKTVIPFSFWVLSIAGSVLLSAYAIYRKDPVFILGQTPSVFIYVRNIVLQRREMQREQQSQQEVNSQSM